MTGDDTHAGTDDSGTDDSGTGDPRTSAMSPDAQAAEPVSALLARGEASSPALIVPEDGQAMTYAQLATRVETLAGRLAAWASGAAIASRWPCRTAPTSWRSCWRSPPLGAAAAPLNPAYTDDEFRFYLTTSARGCCSSRHRVGRRRQRPAAAGHADDGARRPRGRSDGPA